MDAEGRPWLDYPFAIDGLGTWAALTAYFGECAMGQCLGRLAGPTSVSNTCRRKQTCVRVQCTCKHVLCKSCHGLPSYTRGRIASPVPPMCLTKSYPFANTNTRAEEYVALYYAAGDAAVVEDAELQAWWNEVKVRGGRGGGGGRAWL